MPKQVKKKAKMWDFAFLEAARFARSEQAGNPRFCNYRPLKNQPLFINNIAF